MAMFSHLWERMSSVRRHRGLVLLLTLTAMFWFVGLIIQILLLNNALNHVQSYPLSWRHFVVDYRSRFGRDPPVGLENWLRFAQERECAVMRFYDAIEHDLAPFRKQAPLNASEVFEAAKAATPAGHFRISIHNYQLRVEAGPSGANDYVSFVTDHRFRWLLDPIVRHSPPVSIDFVVNIHDGPVDPLRLPTLPLAPIFSWCQFVDTDHNDNVNGAFDDDLIRNIRFPYVDNVSSPVARFVEFVSKAFGRLRNGFQYGFSEPDWEDKKPTIVWRGSSTGTLIGPDHDWRKSPRFRLVEFGDSLQGHKVEDTEVDFALVDIIQCVDDEECKKPKQEFRTDIHRPMEWAVQHKYLMDVDGNAFTSRFPSLLGSHSLVFKATRYREWFSERVLPWVDYIPVNYSYADLASKIEWSNHHQTQSKLMKDHSAMISRKFLRDADMRCYTYRLLLEYASLFN